jgi:hypothetical protein
LFNDACFCLRSISHSQVLLQKMENAAAEAAGSAAVYDVANISLLTEPSRAGPCMCQGLITPQSGPNVAVFISFFVASENH